jgi:hypothetical protein
MEVHGTIRYEIVLMFSEYFNTELCIYDEVRGLYRNHPTNKTEQDCYETLYTYYLCYSFGLYGAE